MTIQITLHEASKAGEPGKVTCTTCKLKKCVGRCHWESLPKGKAA